MSSSPGAAIEELVLILANVRTYAAQVRRELVRRSTSPAPNVEAEFKELELLTISLHSLETSTTSFTGAVPRLRASVEDLKLRIKEAHQQNIQLRSLLLLVAEAVEDAAQGNPPTGPMSVALPADVAACLYSVGASHSLARAALELAGGVSHPAVTTPDGVFIYPAPVRCNKSTEKALLLQDMVSGKSFWVPRRVVHEDSTVRDAYDEGELRILSNFAESKNYFKEEQSLPL
jgi:hypothetical protein